MDRLLARMLPANPEDDVAVIAVRLHRRDRLRPGQACPQRVRPRTGPMSRTCLHRQLVPPPRRVIMHRSPADQRSAGARGAQRG